MMVRLSNFAFSTTSRGSPLILIGGNALLNVQFFAFFSCCFIHDYVQYIELHSEQIARGNTDSFRLR